jgi:inorganic pyrophosphatase
MRIPPFAKDGAVHVVVEIPKGCRNKYEYRPDLGVIALDRTLYSAVHYPTDYGFVPGTSGADGDPIDAMVLVEQETFPGCLVTVRLIGVVTIERTDGSPEPKLLGVPVAEPRFAEYRDIADLPQHLLREIEHFLSVFKDLEGSDIRVRGWDGPERARAALERELIR